MTPTKIALAGAAMTVLLIMFATRPAPAPEPPDPPAPADHLAPQMEPEKLTRYIQTPFDHPAWEPDEATKRKALMRAYHMNGGSMVGDHMIDVSQPEGIVADPGVVNELYEQADTPNWEARRRFMNRTFRETHDQLTHRSEAETEDTCAKHGMHRVEYRKTWRCRK